MTKTGGNKLQTTAVKNDESKIEAAKTAQSTPPLDGKNEILDPMSPQSALAALQSDVQPVGHDYVEEVSEELLKGKVTESNLCHVATCEQSFFFLILI